MYLGNYDNGLGAGGFIFPVPSLSLGTKLPSYPLPTVEAPKISLAAPVVEPLTLPPGAYGWPQPKPISIPIPPIVAPIAPMPVVNIQQAVPAPKPVMPKWAIPAMVGGGGLILLLALMPKKKGA